MAPRSLSPPTQIFDTVCTFPLTSDVFAQSIHPKSPLLALGLASGHVQVHRLPPCHHPSDGSSPDGSPTQLGQGTIDTAWHTRRHKGSCRSLSFSADGAFLFSAGSDDGLVKAAATETGRVVSKIAVPLNGSVPDPATLIHTLSPQSFLLATDSSALHIYDLRAPASFASSRPQQTYHPHEDYISSLSPLPAGDASNTGFSKQWISTGGTSIGVTDLRRGVLKVEDLGEELLSSVVVGDGTVIVGGERGVLRIWKDGLLGKESGRVVVERGETLDVLARAPAGTGKGKREGETVVVGLGDGRVKVVNVQQRKVIGEVRHDEIEGVLGLGFEIDGRMISGGGPTVKVWEESIGSKTEDVELAATGITTTTTTSNGDGANNNNHNNNNNDDDDDDNSDSDDAAEAASSSSEEEEEEETKPRKRRKKRKRNGGAKAGNQNQNQNHQHHHVLSSFSGID